MNLKVNIIIFFYFIIVLESQNVDPTIDDKVQLRTNEDVENINRSNEEKSEHKSYQSYEQQKNSDLIEVQQLQQELHSDIQSDKLHHSNYAIRTIFSNSNIDSDNDNILSKQQSSIIQSPNLFIKSDDQQVVQQQQSENKIESLYPMHQSALVSISKLDTKHQDNWPYASNSQNIITIKPNEYMVNSSSLNFTNQGIENLKIFNITSTNRIMPLLNTFTNNIPVSNYNQEDPLSPMQIIANPIQNLVLRSFENFRHLIKNSESIENFLIAKMNLPKWSKIYTLDPLNYPEILYFEHRDLKTPLLGKLKYTLENVQIYGLSTFEIENLSNQGRTMYFKHRIPQLDFYANYTVDYNLFDEIPLLISKGHLKAIVPNAYIKGSFSVLPDILNVWFKIANLDLSSSNDEADIKVYPILSISDRFRIERSTLNKLGTAIKSIMPKIVEYFKLTYSKTIEMKIV